MISHPGAEDSVVREFAEQTARNRDEARARRAEIERIIAEHLGPRRLTAKLIQHRLSGDLPLSIRAIQRHMQKINAKSESTNATRLVGQLHLPHDDTHGHTPIPRAAGTTGLLADRGSRGNHAEPLDDQPTRRERRNQKPKGRTPAPRPQSGARTTLRRGIGLYERNQPNSEDIKVNQDFNARRSEILESRAGRIPTRDSASHEATSGYKEFPKVLKHPDHSPPRLVSPAIPGRASSAIPTDCGNGTEAVWQPEKFPPMTVANTTEEARFVAEGYVAAGTADPIAFDHCMNTGPTPPPREFAEFPKWCTRASGEPVLVRTAAEEEALIAQEDRRKRA
jgi:hypothetical protein